LFTVNREADVTMSVPNQWFCPRGTLARGAWESVVDSAIDGWRHTGLRIAVLADGDLELYYLNVMAGPDPERVWLVSDDPHQAWIRGQWARQEPDPRLPFRSGDAPAFRSADAPAWDRTIR
jgi:KduI/IolB family